MENDTFERGQWFKGRVYERECDLSFDGKYLIYFAATNRPPLYRWLAISKLPYFTALAFWPSGSIVGGGLFISADTFALRNAIYSAKPPGMIGSPFRMLEGREHSDEVMDGRAVMRRSGWTILNEIEDEELLMQKPHPTLPFRLQLFTNDFSGRGSKTVLRYRAFSEDNEIFPWQRWSWADWDVSGDLLYATDGKIFRSAMTQSTIGPGVELADFCHDTFSEVRPPTEALKW
jgi:hypothetical protein